MLVFVPRTFLELFLKVKGTFPEHSPKKWNLKITYMEHSYNVLVWFPKNNLMGPFGNV